MQKVSGLISKRFLSASILILTLAALLMTYRATHASGVLALDKVVTKNQATASSSVTTAAFSTVEANELLVAFVASDGPNTANGQTVTGITGGGLTWTLRQRVNTQFGTSEIWQAKAVSILSNITVKATLSSSRVSSLNVAAFKGADLTTNGAVGAANGSTGAPSVNVTATRNGSWIWGVGNDYDRAVARTVGSNQTKVAEYLATVGDTFWVQDQTSAGGSAGVTTTLNDTAPTNDRWNFAAIEILPAVTDTQAPTAPTGLTANATAPTNVNLSWTASTDDVGVTGYKIYRDGTQIGTSAATGYSDTTTVASTSYSYTVRAYDAASNTSGDSNTANVTTPTPDTTAPTLSNITAGSITQTGTNVTWTTNEASDTQVEYGLTASYGSSTPFDASLVTSHSATINGLTSNTTYHYRVKSKDASGNLATSGDNVFTTLAPAPDTTPPTTAITSPSNGGTVSATTTVTASASDNVGVVGVQFKLDGNNLSAEDTASPYSISWDTTGASNGSHQLTSVARDAAGNTTTSTVVTVTVSNGVGGGTPLTINGSQHFQTMYGFGTSINSGAWNGESLKPALDKLIDGGSSIMRVVAEQSNWETVNDNSDPNTFNMDTNDPNSYASIYANSPQFQKLWATMSYLNTKGINNDMILDFMGKGPSWMMSNPSNSKDHTLNTTSTTYEDEWAEMVVSAAYYGRVVKGINFGYFAPNNEPDWDVIEGIKMSPQIWAESMNKVAQRLDQLAVTYPEMGTIRLIGPDAANACNSVQDYRVEMIKKNADGTQKYAALLSKFDHFTLHSYSGGDCDATDNINSSPVTAGKDFWMSEFGTFADGMTNIGQGTTALLPWDGFDSVYQHSIDNGNSTTAPNDAGNSPALLCNDGSCAAYSPRKEYYQFAQLFKYVPKGSIRIGAAESNGSVTTYAFFDPVSNRVTIVGQNRGSTAVNFSGTLANLPAVPSFEYYTTTNSVNLQRGSDVVVTGGAFSVVAPGNGIFTLTTAAPTDQTPPSAPTNLQATGSIGAANLSWTPATDNIGITAYNVYRSTTSGFTPSAGNNIGQTASTSYSDTAAPAGTYYYKVTAQDAAANIGPESNEASATVLADTTPPTAPNALQTTSVGGQSVGLSWTASTDNVGVTGYKVYRNGTFLANSASTSYTDSTVSPSTSYTYYVTAVDGATNESGQSNTINVTTTSVTLAVDTQVVTHQSSAASTITSPSLTTTVPNTLLVAFLTSDGSSGTAQTFSSVTSPGLTWTLRKRVNTQAGNSEIWTAPASSVLTNTTVTATRGSGSYVGSMVVTAFKGAKTNTIDATGGGSASTGAPSTTLTTTAAGSWVWGVGNNWDAATTVTVGSGQTKVDEFQASVGDTFWVQRLNTLSTASGQVITINDTAPANNRWNLAAIEILPQ